MDDVEQWEHDEEHPRDMYQPYEVPKARLAKRGYAMQAISEGRAILERQGKKSA